MKMKSTRQSDSVISCERERWWWRGSQ